MLGDAKPLLQPWDLHPLIGGSEALDITNQLRPEEHGSDDETPEQPDLDAKT
jgi:hypothetical protein